MILLMPQFAYSIFKGNKRPMALSLMMLFYLGTGHVFFYICTRPELGLSGFKAEALFPSYAAFLVVLIVIIIFVLGRTESDMRTSIDATSSFAAL